MAKYVPASAGETAFNCPHCGAFARQFWHIVHIEPMKANQVPGVWTTLDVAEKDFSAFPEEKRHDLETFFNRLAEGRPFKRNSENYNDPVLHNVAVSECFNCQEFCLWVYGKLIWPSSTGAPEANADLPPLVRQAYDEAGTILHLSPRGASALLRLAVQQLTIHLGGKGRNLDDDIAALVQGGLDSRVQIALDVVRVIGNNAVHPGQLDIKDDQATAEKLFGLVNMIAEIMISQPKHLALMFDQLPDGARKAIERRDGKSAASPDTANPSETK